MYYVAYIVFLFCKSVYKILELGYYWPGKSRLIVVYSVLRFFPAHLQKMGLLLYIFDWCSVLELKKLSISNLIREKIYSDIKLGCFFNHAVIKSYFVMFNFNPNRYIGYSF